LFIWSDRRQIAIALQSVDWVESATNILRTESITVAFWAVGIDGLCRGNIRCVNI